MERGAVQSIKCQSRRHQRRAVLALGGLWLATLAAGCEEPPPTGTVAVVARQLPPAPSARFVKLEELSEWNGHAWGSVAEFNLIDATGATLERKAWSASADSATESDPASNAIDGDPRSIWHTPWLGDNPPPPPHALTIKLGASVRISGFRYLARQDKLVNGTLAKYRLYLSDNGVDWGQPVTTGDFTSMSSPMVEKTVIFATQTPNHAPEVEPIEARGTRMGQPVTLRVRATDPDGDALAYAATRLPLGLAIDPRTGQVDGTPIVPGNASVDVAVSDPKGATTHATFAWTVQPPAPGGGALATNEVRFVKLEALSEVEGRPWAAIAELNLLDATGAVLSRAGWSAAADSAGSADGPGNAIDGNAGSLWHTRWSDDAPPYPHLLVIDMGRGAVVRGLRMLPRQDTLTNGTIARFRLFVSRDGLSWGTALAEGDFSAMPGGPHGEKTFLVDK